MQGRYGLDQFSKALLIGGLIVVLLSSFFAGGRAGSLFYLLGWILIIYCYFRIFSKNVSKRYAENQKYLAKTYKIRTYIQQQKNSLAQRKAYHIYKCPGCKQKIRIPKGKGKIEIRCPKCGTTFIKKSWQVYWRRAICYDIQVLLVAHRVNSNQKSFKASPSSVEIRNTNCHK